MLGTETAPSSSTRPRRTANRLPRPAGRRRGVEPEASALDTPAIVTVFLEPSGAICHARCREPLTYQGTRGRLEVDFYCLRCVEHVSLPLHVLPRIPKSPREGVVGMSQAPTVSSLPAVTQGAA